MSLRQKQRERAGCIQLRRSRALGVVVGVYNAVEAGLDPDGGAWATVCEDHGAIVNHETRATALNFAPYPDNWCEDCRELRDDSTDRCEIIEEIARRPPRLEATPDGGGRA